MMLTQYRSKIKSKIDICESLGEDGDSFFREIAFLNFKRFSIFAKICFAIFTPLFFLDVYYYLSGKWQISLGYKILFFSHMSVVILTIAGMAFSRMNPAHHQDELKTIHKPVVDIFIFAVLINIVAISSGDVLINGSIAAFLGAIFSFASIVMMTNFYSVLLFLSGMVSMLISLIIVSLMTSNPMSIQMINAIAFAIVALTLSRVLFYYQIRDFKGRKTNEEQTKALQTSNKELQEAIASIKTLKGLLPICSYCKKIRDDKGYWNRIENYIQAHSEAEFSHGICQECLKKYHSDIDIN
jgi:hypothetical protein